MDWARDNAYLSSERDMRLFSYQARRAVVVKIVESNTVGVSNDVSYPMTNQQSSNHRNGVSKPMKIGQCGWTQ
jgi:hypothetical protein